MAFFQRTSRRSGSGVASLGSDELGKAAFMDGKFKRLVK
jgi:hypothetical protein